MTGKFSDSSRDRDRTMTRATGLDMLPTGTVLAERYRIEEVIGVGGMGMIYRARDLQLDADVALKLLRTDQRPDPDALDRLRREVLLARRVSHPNVVRSHDLGRDGDIVFLTMDYIPGQTLRERLAESTFSVEQAIRLGIQLAEALAAAHDQNVVHRDLKPGNILIDDQGNAHILDFGVARAMNEESLTVAGEVMGTPAYLSPEQVRGEPVDHRSDIFTLGLILCEALSGRLPNEDSTIDELLGQRATGRTTDPTTLRPDLPGWLARILRNCLAPRPDDRYQDAATLARDLESGAARSTVRRRWRAGVAAIAALGLTAFLIWSWWPTERQPGPGSGEAVHLAVMPLHNASERATLDWTSRGLAQGLSESLAEAPGMQVVDSLRLFRMIEDLGIPPGVPDRSLRRQLFELLGLDRLITGRIDSTDQGLRIELLMHDQRSDNPVRIAVGASADSPLSILPDLTGRILERLTGEQPDLPAPPTSDNVEALEQFDAGIARLSQRDYVGAVAALERAVEADPDYAAAWAHLAEARAAAGRHGPAVDSARTAVELLTEHDGRLALEAQARLARLRGEPERARDILQSLIERFPDDIQARIQLSSLLIDLGRMDQA
ncbi:MAG: protein kinase domain-containing protein, partial [Wenzhouxiangella sp.]